MSNLVKVHPAVLISIIDFYERRSDNTARIIGTLLGQIEKGVIEVSNCFCVPHDESNEEVALELDFAKQMYNLHQSVNPNEVVVGWFASGNEITDQSLLIHDYYKKVAGCTNPIHLTIDTTLASGHMDMQVYVRVPVGVPDGTMGAMFSPIESQIISYPAELVGVRESLNTSLTHAGQPNEPISDMRLIADAVKCIEKQLQTVTPYLDGVLSGEKEKDMQVGRELFKMVNNVPKMTTIEFEDMINSNMKDMLMVIYLAELAKVNVTLNEKVTLLASAATSTN